MDWQHQQAWELVTDAESQALLSPDYLNNNLKINSSPAESQVH